MGREGGSGPDVGKKENECASAQAPSKDAKADVERREGSGPQVGTKERKNAIVQGPSKEAEPAPKHDDGKEEGECTSEDEEKGINRTATVERYLKKMLGSGSKEVCGDKKEKKERKEG